jgi:type IV pilus assembly protein PilQ
MTRVRHIAALSAACLLTMFGARRADAEHSKRDNAPGSVTAVSVTPGTGRADVVIAIEGPIEVFDFTLEAPRRIVVDLRGATLGVAARLYDKIARGGITNVRLAQYKPGIVRVVLDLDGAREYTIARGEKEIRISVAGPDQFPAWNLAAGTAAAPRAAVAGRAVAAQDPKATPRPTSAPSSPETAQKSPERQITVTFQETHIRDVITSFAQFSGRTIVVGRQVDGFVTADIRDQPWDLSLIHI